MQDFIPVRGTYDDQRQCLVLPVSPLRSLILYGWSQGLQVVLETQSGRTAQDAPPCMVLDPSAAPSPLRSAIRAYIQTIPTDDLLSVLPYQWRQFTILQLVHASPAYQSLLRESPMIAWLLADHVRVAGFPIPAAAALCQKKRRDILTAIFGDCAQTLVKTLGKVVPSASDRHDLHVLRSLCSSPEIASSLTHCRTIHLGALAVCVDTPELLEHPLVQREIEANDASPSRLRVIKMLLHGCSRFKDQYTDADFTGLLRQCRGLDELRELFQNLHARYNLTLARQRGALAQEEEKSAALRAHLAPEAQQRPRRPRRPRRPGNPAPARQRVLEEQPDGRHLPPRAAPFPVPSFFETNPDTGERKRIGLRFPSPPLPGNAYIQPLTSSGQLVEEGEIMRNCVGKGYSRDVLAGNSYVYRVLHPQRCTLEIGFRHDGSPYVKDLKGPDNSAPSRSTRRFIKDWLAGRHS